ncbi:MAG: heme-binding domain-containing protein [Ignavibacteriaceae bacterium]|nr:heme-binding domain-containing protein [Ignavibacteriaceae bacterium]
MKKIIITLAVIILAIQFFPVKRDNPLISADFYTPAVVKNIFEKGCYNCHSNQTEWPWYAYIAPVSWIVAQNVNDGRAKLNFSEWGNYPGDKSAKLMGKIWEELDEDRMPPGLYLLMHSDSKISIEEKSLIKSWAGK